MAMIMLKTKKLFTFFLSASLTTFAVTIPSTPILGTEFNPQEQVSINVYRQANPAVVTIKARGDSGSGTIVGSQGLIITNEHVVRQARGGQVNVITANGRNYSGQVIATDPNHDLALVKLNTQGNFPTIPLADGDGIQVGQHVYAIGNPFGFSGTLTTGILSRIAPNGDLQTDAAINPGNSGGPLLNSQGELIGVNKGIYSPGGRGNIGIGFATSALEARRLISSGGNSLGSGESSSLDSARSTPRQDNDGRDNNNNLPSPPVSPVPVSPSPAPNLGVDINSQTLVIESVETNSAAERLGLRVGDRLVAVNDLRLYSVEDLVSVLDSSSQEVSLTIVRNYRVISVQGSF